MFYLDASLELSSHGNDSVGHSLDVAAELSVQGGVVEDLGSDSSAMGRWVRVHWSDQDLNEKSKEQGWRNTEHTLIWDSTRAASSESLQTTVKAPVRWP